MSAEQLADRIRLELPALDLVQQAELVGIVQRLVTAFQPERIYVFGSHGRGDAGPDSDIDLLVVVSSADRPNYQPAQAARRVIGRHSMALDVLVMRH